TQVTYGQIRTEQGHADEVIDQLRDALNFYSRLATSGARQRLRAYAAYAEAASMVPGRAAEVIKGYPDIVARLEALKEGGVKAEEAQALASYALVLAETGEPERAAPMARNAWNALKDDPRGQDNPEALRAARKYARVLETKKDINAAQVLQ